MITNVDMDNVMQLQKAPVEGVSIVYQMVAIITAGSTIRAV